MMALSDSELVARARELAPGIRARAAEVAKMRKPHDDSIKELLDAGIIQMFVPKRWGGSEASLTTLPEVVEIISAACPSTAWVTAFYISHVIHAVYFPEQTQEEMFGTKGYALLPGGFSPDLNARKVDGGWEVSGRTLWASGIVHADWALTAGRAGDEVRAFVIPTTDIEVLDTWYLTGMSGTGSNDFVADKVFVPDHHSIPLGNLLNGISQGAELHGNPMYSLPFLIGAYCTFLPVITGGLDGALQAYKEIVNARKVDGMAIKEQQHTQVMLGEMQLAVNVAKEIARSVYNHAGKVSRGYTLTEQEKLLLKGQTAFAANHCRDTVNKMMATAGSSAFHIDQPLQRIWRDINVICSHGFIDWGRTRELVGKECLTLSAE